jgi:tetratricopeptide (TPR) repeat protein
MTARRRDSLLFGGALAIRLAHLAFVLPSPLFRYLLIDSQFYDAVGRRLASGEGFPDGPFFMNVLYGAFLGAIYALFGADGTGRVPALVVQCVLGAATVVILARLGDALGRPRSGTIAAIGLALTGPAVFYDAALLTPTLLLFLTTLVVWLAALNRAGRLPLAAALGGVTGLLILGRANNALLLPAFALWFLRSGRKGVAPALVTVLVAAVLVSPATIRNAREAHEFVAVSANGGMALWAGNHPGATGIYSEPPFLSNPVPEREAEDYRVEASRRAGRGLTLAESSRLWTSETFHRWADDPAATARLFLRKLRIYLNATESQTNLSYYFARDFSPVLQILRLHLGWILPLALLGIARSGRRLILPLLPVLVSVVTCVIFYVSSEYRHPALPCFLLFAAVGAEWVVGVFRAARARPSPAPIARAIGAGVLLLALVVFTNHRDAFLNRLVTRRVDYLNFATLAATAGDLPEAEHLIRRSIAIDPAWAPSRQEYARILSGLGRVREAAEQGDLAERLSGEPESLVSREMSRGAELLTEGRLEDAERHFRRLAEQKPEVAAQALNNAGLCALKRGHVAAAESLLHAAIARDPAYASPWVHLGRLSLLAADSVAAATCARTALELAPADERALRLLQRATGE